MRDTKNLKAFQVGLKNLYSLGLSRLGSRFAYFQDNTKLD